MLKPEGRRARKALFERIGKAISRKDLLQGWDGRYVFEMRAQPVQDRATTAFRGQLGRDAPRVKTMQWERLLKRQ